VVAAEYADLERSTGMDSSVHVHGLRIEQSCKAGYSQLGRVTSMRPLVDRKRSSGSTSSPWGACVQNRNDRRTRKTQGLLSPLCASLPKYQNVWDIWVLAVQEEAREK